MNVLKARLFNKDNEKYHKSIEDLAINYFSKEYDGKFELAINYFCKESVGKFEVEEVELNDYKIFRDVSEIVWKYNN